MRQLLTPLYMLLQSIFVIVQYRIVRQQFGIEGLNELILILSAAIPFQIFNLGMGHYVYAQGDSKLGSRKQVEALELTVISSLLGLPIIIFILSLFGISFSGSYLLTGGLFLFCANLNSFLFLAYDGGGASYLRSIVASIVSLVTLLVSSFMAYFTSVEIINPVAWFAVSYLLILIFLLRPFTKEWKWYKFDRILLFKSGVQYNLMMLPSLSFDFIIKSTLSVTAPAFLPLFDIINKLLQQIGSLITMMNQAFSQRIKFSGRSDLVSISIISVAIYLVLCTTVYVVLPFILDYTGIAKALDTRLIFVAVAIGWLFNTFSAPWYFSNILQSRVKYNTKANFSTMITLIALGGVGRLYNIPIYYVWTVSLIIGSIIVINYQNLLYLVRVFSFEIIALVIIAILNFLFIDNMYISTLAVVAYSFIASIKINNIRKIPIVSNAVE